MERINGKTCSADIYLEQTDKFGGFYLCVCLTLPLRADEAAKNRLLPMVLGDSCEKYPSQTALYRALADMGAVLGAQTIKKGGYSVIQFLISLPNKNREKAFEMLSELLNRPLVKNGGFVVSKKKHLKNITVNKMSDPKSLALDKCAELMFGKKGFGIDGDGYPDENTDDLYAYYCSVMKNSGADIFAVGDMGSEEMLRLCEKYFSWLENNKKACEPFSPLPFQRVYEKADIAQAKLCIGVDMGRGSRFEKTVFNEILGMGGNSRLFNTVREENNLCYYIGSTYYSLANAMFIQAGIEPQNADKTIELVKKLMEAPVSGSEIQRAKQAITNRLKNAADHPSALMDRCLTQSLSKEAEEDMIRAVNSVTKLDISPDIRAVYILGGEVG